MTTILSYALIDTPASKVTEDDIGPNNGNVTLSVIIRLYYIGMQSLKYRIKFLLYFLDCCQIIKNKALTSKCFFSFCTTIFSISIFILYLITRNISK